MKKCREFFATLSDTVTITKLDGVLMLAISALAGVIVGMLCSPRKNTIWNNGNTVTKNWNGDDMEDMFEDEFDEFESVF